MDQSQENSIEDIYIRDIDDLEKNIKSAAKTASKKKITVRIWWHRKIIWSCNEFSEGELTKDTFN